MHNSTITPDVDLSPVDLATEKATINVGFLEHPAIGLLLIEPNSGQLAQGTVTGQSLLTKSVNYRTHCHTLVHINLLDLRDKSF